jgi:hypothetical protein
MSATRVERRGRGRRGQALVEFALIFPVFMLIIVALFDVGRAVFAYNTLTNAAREAARLGIVNQDLTSIRARAIGQAVSLGLAPGDIAVEFREDGLDPVANPVCTTPKLGCVVIVSVSYDWQAVTPIVGQIVGPLQLASRSVFPVEFLCPNTSIPNAASCPRQP